MSGVPGSCFTFFRNRSPRRWSADLSNISGLVSFCLTRAMISERDSPGIVTLHSFGDGHYCVGNRYERTGRLAFQDHAALETPFQRRHHEVR